MREVRPKDAILHLIDNKCIAGVSIASDVARPNFVGLEGTDWAGQACYRISLQNYSRLNPPIDREDFFESADAKRELLKILSNHTGLFYTRDLELNQKAYLTKAPSPLVTLFDNLYRSKSGATLPNISTRRDRLDLKTNRLRAAIKLFRWTYGEDGFTSARYLEGVMYFSA